MKTLCFYISDYGFGHAARAIALIRELISASEEIWVIAKTSGPYDFARRSLVHPRVSVVQCRNDCDVVLMPGLATVDRVRTQEEFLAWMRAWDDYVAQETAFCRAHHVDLVVSDISPQAFEIAEEMGVPSFAVSNFTWATIFGHLFPELDAVNRLQDAYGKASCACILPFEIDMETFPRSERIGLVSRPISVPRREMRQRLDIPDDEVLVFVGKSPEIADTALSSQRDCSNFPDVNPGLDGTEVPSGIPSNEGTDLRRPRHHRKTFRVVAPSGSTIPGALSIPTAETESQNWIGMCDCVVTKCGYSTVSEAVRARVPLLVWKREGFIEDEAIAAQIERLGIGRAVTGASKGIDELYHNYSSIQTYHERYDTLDGRFATDGIPEVLRVIQEMIR